MNQGLGSMGCGVGPRSAVLGRARRDVTADAGAATGGGHTAAAAYHMIMTFPARYRETTVSRNV